MKKRNWKAWVLFGVLMAAGAGIGINPAIMQPVADQISLAAEIALEQE